MQRKNSQLKASSNINFQPNEAFFFKIQSNWAVSDDSSPVQAAVWVKELSQVYQEKYKREEIIDVLSH